MSDSVQVQTLNQGRLGRIHLDSPKTLNTLDLEMVQTITRSLNEFIQDSKVEAILLSGEGDRAFCAGGNVKQLALEANRELTIARNYAQDFFKNEYAADQAVHLCPKPIIALGHKIVMGGGLGLIAGARLKVLEASTILAMPEVTIGLYPDVGATYFLPRLPHRIGLFLGLTGARFTAADALALGLIHAVIPDGARASLSEKICESNELTESALRALVLEAGGCFEASKLDRIGAKTHLTPERRKTLEPVLKAKSLREADRALRALSSSSDPWVRASVDTYLKGCPTSAAVFWKMFEFGATASLKDCFERELLVSVQMVLEHNFKEGVRALLVDKDQKPKWIPERLDEVSVTAFDSR